MIDKNEAPEGYEAVKEERAYSCKGCDLADDNSNCTVSRMPCSRLFRTDNSNVIFVKKSKEINMKFDESRVCTVGDGNYLCIGDKVITANSIKGLQSLVEDKNCVAVEETILDMAKSKGFHTDYQEPFYTEPYYYEYAYLLERTPKKELSVSDYKRMKVIAEKGIIDILDAFETATKSDVTDINFIDSDHVKLEAEFWD